jgi:hypothetical protein
MQWDFMAVEDVSEARVVQIGERDSAMGEEIEGLALSYGIRDVHAGIFSVSGLGRM